VSVRRRSALGYGLGIGLGLLTLAWGPLLLYWGWGTGFAQDLPGVEMSLTARPTASGGAGEYRLTLMNLEEEAISLDEIRVFLPAGQSYVGLAVGSEIDGEPLEEEGRISQAVAFVEGAVVAAGAVVTKGIPSYAIARGVPATIVGQRG